LHNYLKSPVLFRATTQRRKGNTPHFGSRNDATAQRELPLLDRATTQQRNGNTPVLFRATTQRRNGNTPHFGSRNDAKAQREKLSYKNLAFRVTIDLSEDTL